MALKKFTQDQIEDLAMIEMAKEILGANNKKAMDFRELFDQIAEIKGFSDAEKEAKLAQFYTDLNIDGSFLTIGSNLWGLKRWYPVDQIDDDVSAPKKKKKKKKKAAAKPKKEEVVAEPEADLSLDEEELDFDDSDLDDDFDDFDLDDEFDDSEEDVGNEDDDLDSSDEEKIK
ncbi:DNA-directed RNA polymerase subunit delta [Aquibacillus sediminis]|uniref:DNA-directed RNA polymerase subunit delta n=1 Tax=Aquibacillus sediminis TaxID=2574734 RepID=UPI0011086E1A|nr:DNA-directed RNA polymerase subunit delta [Aquibacillus sediminis]